jgi:hypothetical protein
VFLVVRRTSHLSRGVLQYYSPFVGGACAGRVGVVAQ